MQSLSTILYQARYSSFENQPIPQVEHNFITPNTIQQVSQAATPASNSTAITTLSHSLHPISSLVIANKFTPSSRHYNRPDHQPSFTPITKSTITLKEANPNLLLTGESSLYGNQETSYSAEPTFTANNFSMPTKPVVTRTSSTTTNQSSMLSQNPDASTIAMPFTFQPYADEKLSNQQHFIIAVDAQYFLNLLFIRPTESYHYDAMRKKGIIEGIEKLTAARNKGGRFYFYLTDWAAHHSPENYLIIDPWKVLNLPARPQLGTTNKGTRRANVLTNKIIKALQELEYLTTLNTSGKPLFEAYPLDCSLKMP